MTSAVPSSTQAGHQDRASTLTEVVPARLVFEQVTKRWRGAPAPVLDEVDLTLTRGTIAAVVGRNGAGKTTLLRIASGLITPTSGRTRLDGLDSVKQRREYQRRVGFVSAGYGGLYARLSVREHLELAAKLALMPRLERKIAIETVIHRFQLEDLLPAPRVDRLSMGQRQRVRLALGFVHDPQVALLDEPWNSLDPEGKEMVMAALKVFAAGGGAALCCSPTGEELGPHADAAYGIEAGRLVPL
jgi:ABC-2 type transport system ATP-binding protein